MFGGFKIDRSHPKAFEQVAVQRPAPRIPKFEVWFIRFGVIFTKNSETYTQTSNNIVELVASDDQDPQHQILRCETPEPHPHRAMTPCKK